VAVFLTPAHTMRLIALSTNSTYVEPHDSTLVLFTDPPSMGSLDGSDGVEVVGGGYARPVVDFGDPTPGVAGRTGQGTNVSAVSIPDMPVASSEIVGLGLANAQTGEIWIVDDSWTPSVDFEVGGGFTLAPHELDLFGVPTASA
jgi:hypothetical protein